MTEPISRRGVLIGSLALALTATASGATGLRAQAAEGGDRVIPVMDDYTITNKATGCKVTVKIRRGRRIITSNGLPNTPPGTFPNPNCPNTIAPQSYSFDLPANPKRTSIEGFEIPQPFGIAVDGVLFDPFAAEFWNNDRNSGWQYYALGGGVNLGFDSNHAHVQPSGAYHYHGIPTGLLESLSKSRHSPLLGWAGDGFPIYVTYGYDNPKKGNGKVRAMKSSYRLKSGDRPSGPGGPYNGWFNQDYEYVAGAGDLDAANGRFCVTPEYPKGTYAYFLTSAFPSVPNSFAGSIAPSFVVTGPSGGRPPGANPPPGPPPPRP